MVPAKVPGSSALQRRAPLRHVGQELLQQPPQDAVVGETGHALAQALAPAASGPLGADVLVDVLQRGVQRLVHGRFGAGPGAGAPMASAVPPTSAFSPSHPGRRALFPTERHGADQEGQLGEARVGLRERRRVGVRGRVDRSGGSGSQGRPRLQTGALALMLAHGGEARVGGWAAAFAGADEVAVLETLALAQALVALEVMAVAVAVVVVVVEVMEELVAAGGRGVEALG